MATIASVTRSLVLLIALLQWKTFSAAASTQKCAVDVSKDLNASSPLLLHPRSLEIIYPSKTSPRILSFSSGDEHVLQCFGGELEPTFFSTSDLSKCINGTTFSSVSKCKEYTIDQVHCSKNPEATMREDNSRKCENGIVVNVGYQLNSNNKFLTTIDLCYVDELATTTWAHSKIPAAVGAGFRSKEPPVAAFGKGHYFKNVLMGRVYPRNNQVQTFMQIFDGNKALVDDYLPSSGDKKNYFVKGHLVARADKFYYAEQHSTYFYVNALPMWQSINNGNWRSIESTVRRIAGIVGGEIDVWTGGLDVLKLSGREIFLATDKKNSMKKLVPAPKLLFKLVYHEKNNEALVFVTVNNPYMNETSVPREYAICEEYPQCTDKFKQFRQRYEGYTYCCTYDDFVKNNSRNFLPVDIRNPKPLTLH